MAADVGIRVRGRESWLGQEVRQHLPRRDTNILPVDEEKLGELTQVRALVQGSGRQCGAERGNPGRQRLRLRVAAQPLADDDGVPLGRQGCPACCLGARGKGGRVPPGGDNQNTTHIGVDYELRVERGCHDQLQFGVRRASEKGEDGEVTESTQLRRPLIEAPIVEGLRQPA